jgi:deoxyadenosine/deoxycytidine kinase
MSSQSSKSPTIVALDGNIGAGKSTLAGELRRRGRTVIVESVDDGWGDTLAKFYEDPKRWCFLLQTRILIDMREQLDEARESSDNYVFIERSPRSALVFVEQSFADGNLTETERAVYRELQKRLGWRPHHAAYLDVPAEECARRMRQRARAAENGVSNEYVASIGARYKSMLDDISEWGTRRFDGTKTTEELADVIEEAYPRQVE